ncbi:hypothetical protein IMX26_01150 [Clostridium sp. 'deep sea']|uniref:hypothetical protein n=1 Tax=Clostridium sp. 'deep sea' TaxID=2779445 RepID=UPI00189692DF|nr:hypothetical protein [Clostridium sp. 'deep sea']QOR35483.1 hypothetical protein IMX26_01150 [Clostridium sp. 'deep sea']
MLYKHFHNAAWLDGDDVWRVNPFDVNDKRLRNSDLNMAFVVENYLKSGFEYVFFSSIVLCDKTIRERILDLIKYKEYELIFITLYANEDTLKQRAKERDNNNDPKFLLLNRSLAQESIFINTATNSLQETVKQIVEIVS